MGRWRRLFFARFFLFVELAQILYLGRGGVVKLGLLVHGRIVLRTGRGVAQLTGWGQLFVIVPVFGVLVWSRWRRRAAVRVLCGRGELGCGGLVQDNVTVVGLYHGVGDLHGDRCWGGLPRDWGCWTVFHCCGSGHVVFLCCIIFGCCRCGLVVLWCDGGDFKWGLRVGDERFVWVWRGQAAVRLEWGGLDDLGRGLDLHDRSLWSGHN